MYGYSLNKPDFFFYETDTISTRDFKLAQIVLAKLKLITHPVKKRNGLGGGEGA